MIIFPENNPQRLLEVHKPLIQANNIQKKNKDITFKISILNNNIFSKLIKKINIQKSNYSFHSEINDCIPAIFEAKSSEKNLWIIALKANIERKKKNAEKEKANRIMLTNYRNKEKYRYLFKYSFIVKLGLKKYWDIFSTLNIPNYDYPLFDQNNQSIEKEHFPFSEEINTFCDRKLNVSKIIFDSLDNQCSLTFIELENNLIEEKEDNFQDYLNFFSE